MHLIDKDVVFEEVPELERAQTANLLVEAELMSGRNLWMHLRSRYQIGSLKIR